LQVSFSFADHQEPVLELMRRFVWRIMSSRAHGGDSAPSLP
jgi:hypothetical protein